MNKEQTTNDIRKLFKKNNLSYNNIKLKHFKILEYFILEELEIHKKSRNDGFEMFLKNKSDITYKDNKLQSAFFYVSAFYFKKREAVSFNLDGFIGFAGWADSSNVKPFISAFEKWINFLVKKKGITNE